MKNIIKIFFVAVVVISCYSKSILAKQEVDCSAVAERHARISGAYVQWYAECHGATAKTAPKRVTKKAAPKTATSVVVQPKTQPAVAPSESLREEIEKRIEDLAGAFLGTVIISNVVMGLLLFFLWKQNRRLIRSIGKITRIALDNRTKTREDK